MRIACYSLLLLLTLPSPVKESEEGEGVPLRAESLNGFWLDVPFVRQGKNLCGAACISMIMQYWMQKGTPAFLPSEADPVRIADYLYSPGAHGIKGNEIARYLKDRGFLPYLFRGSLSDLTHHMERGRPLMVCVQPGPKQSQRHYLVVVGISPSERVVLVNDPARQKLMKLSQVQFERSWQAAENWTLLILPPSSGHSGNSPAP